MTKEIGHNTIVFYSSIKELPNARKFLAESYQLWQVHVGTSLSQVRNNLVKAIEYIAYDKKQDAINLIQNADMGIESLIESEDFELKELCCYVKSINNITYPFGLLNSNVDEIALSLNLIGITIEDVENYLNEIKKK